MVNLYFWGTEQRARLVKLGTLLSGHHAFEGFLANGEKEKQRALSVRGELFYLNLVLIRTRTMNFTCDKKASESVKNVINIDSLKGYQLEAISSLLSGKDCLISQPAGARKSALYQLFPFAFNALKLLETRTVHLDQKLLDDIICRTYARRYSTSQRRI
jgi:hypothetical protein